jgi:rhamnosyltransferase
MKATIFIPTYNGEKYLDDILTAIFSQELEASYEVLIIDSGSSDNTLEIVKRHKKNRRNLRLHEIPNSEYGHGKTRMLAAQMAKGEIVVYLSHDAIPAHPHWLYEMIKPFELNDKIVGVMGKQLPRLGCFPLIKYDINRVFNNFGPDFGTSVFYQDTFIKEQSTYDAVTFYSDANSAARRDFLINTIGYRDVKYAEDQMFGRDLVDAGYIKAYAPRGSVFHSNDFRIREYKYRMYDETLGLRMAGVPVSCPPIKETTKLILKGALRDSIAILRDGEYGLKRKLYWLAINPMLHVGRWQGIRQGALANLNGDVDAEYSLEARSKK